MSLTTRARRGFAAGVSAALAAGALMIGAGSPAQAAGDTVEDATFTWGLNGYAQVGIFGPWSYKDLTGNASVLTGSVSGGSQNEYVVDPVPATSMPASNPQKSANAVKFTGGEGTVDRSTGAGQLSWAGSYTVNAYPAMYNAPNEIYSDPELTVAADGSGTLTMEFELGEGVDMEGNPVEAEDFGRVKLMTFDAGSLSAKSDTGYRVTPDYQGVEFHPQNGGDQVTCAAGSGTGWWGAWPTEFLEKLDSSTVGQSVLPHFYSTGCGGKNDNKPPLPFDVSYPEAAPSEPGSVTVDKTEVSENGSTEVTVTGSGFDPSLAVGTRPPFAGKQSGVYVAFGRFADTWKPSENAPSSARSTASGSNGNGASIVWAVPGASFPGNPSQDPNSPAYTELKADGSFTATITVDKSWIDRADGNWGIYTYAGSGATVAQYETYTPITFTADEPAPAATTIGVTGLPTSATEGDDLTATVTVGSDEGTPTGSVETFDGDSSVSTDALSDGTATVDLSSLGAGTHNLRFDYTGADGYAASSTNYTLTVSEAGQGSDDPVAPQESDLTDETKGDLTAPDTIKPGETITASLANLASGQPNALTGQTVRAWLFSDPIDLGAVQVGSNGALSITVPTTVPTGAHRLVIAQDDGTVIAWRAVTVAAADASDDDDSTAGGGGSTSTGGTSTDDATNATDASNVDAQAAGQERTTSANNLPATGAPALLWAFGAALLLLSAGVVTLSMRERTA